MRLRASHLAALAIVSVCAVILIAPSQVLAGGGLGLRYTSTTTNWGPDIRREQKTYSPCVGTERLAGIGAAVLGSFDTAIPPNSFPIGDAYHVSIFIANQVPTQTGPDSTWQVAENRFPSTSNLGLYETTVCASGAKVSYPKQRTGAPARQGEVASARCGGGKHVLAGGALLGGPERSQRLVASAPFDSRDRGKRPDDGWRVAVDNFDTRRLGVTVVAICASVRGLSYVRRSYRAPKRARKHVTVPCPAGESIIGGGVRHAIRYGRAALVASAYPGPDPTRWVTEIDNLSRKPAKARSFAICHR